MSSSMDRWKKTQTQTKNGKKSESNTNENQFGQSNWVIYADE